MKRITPKDFYLDLPCSVVSIGTAEETLFGTFNYDKIKMFSDSLRDNDGYADLRSVNAQIRKHLPVKKYSYFPRIQRVTLQTWCNSNKGVMAIVCVLGHFIFCDLTKNCYYSFFDNNNDKVVAVWELQI